MDAEQQAPGSNLNDSRRGPVRSRIPPPPVVAIPKDPALTQTKARWQVFVRMCTAWLFQTWRRLESAVLLRQIPMLRYAPKCLSPAFYWTPTLVGDQQISRHAVTPARLAPAPLRRLMGSCHALLAGVSTYYCAWYGVSPVQHTIMPLPFGLILKWADGTSLDEVRAMMAARKAGIPTPKVISYGQHASTPWAPVSILMTRLPGAEMNDVFPGVLGGDELESITADLQAILDAMRSWENPWLAADGRRGICSISGGKIRSVRVPNHAMGPFEAEEAFTDHLLSTASSHSYATAEDFETTLATARKLYDMPHKILFTHGDFALHNVLVHNGRVSGLIDWECAGWYPEYWEFTTPLRWASPRPEWRSLLMRLGGAKYEKELECEMAIQALTIDSWVY